MSLPLPVSATARQTLKDAFEDLERTVTPADSRDFRTATLQHVRDAALEIEKQLAARGLLRNMRRLTPLFIGLEHYSKAMDTLCSGFPYLPWIWAPIALVLRVASEHVEALEQIIKGYAQLAESIGRFEILGCAYKDNHNFQETLAVFYADILHFHKNAYKFVRRSGWKLLFLTSWVRFQRRLDNIVEDMKRHIDLVDKEANVLNIAQAQEMRRDIRAWREQNVEKVKSLEDKQAIKQYQSIVAWMNIDESDQLAIFESLVSERRSYPKTCWWIFETAKVSSWLEKRPESPILWLQGTPGAGKSVISTQLVTYLQSCKRTVLYHFCTSLYMSSTIYEQILRSLLMQLLRKDGDLVAHVYEDFVLGKKSPTVSALERLLQLLFKSVSAEPSQTEYFWIVLDGLDESHRTLSGNAVCKALISSRSSRTLSRRLRKKQIISLGEEKARLEGAIRLYASQRLQALEHRFRQLDIAPENLDDIERQIAKKADGKVIQIVVALGY
ncbi:NACHT domain-containing protein [Trichoderma gamsii]|uniref:NACHT domain-containing protein n=1 Tax=Trichoderma gamsii TaxID=398673 RepID=A0A2P4ZXR3_9HYPO|nr:NACHT domain-containing protein [Trichoderma gamsii]PON29051.1 NACHT domain-containing protein [Trichoderma gamsii]